VPAGVARPRSYPPDVPPAPDRSPQSGTQTLARGLNALLAVVESPTGMTVQELARVLDVHRSIAYRILQTLADYGFVHSGRDGRYHAGARLAALSHSYLPGLRATALPVMQELADRVGASVALFVVEGESAVAVEMAVPIAAGHHIAFRQGERAPLDRGAAAYALRAALPPDRDDPEPVQRVREVGFAYSQSEVEAGAHAVAAPIRGVHPRACLALISHVEQRALDATAAVVKAAESLSAAVT
jgi:DNA-binding IclR family transcriptional regulator